MGASWRMLLNNKKWWQWQLLLTLLLKLVRLTHLQCESTLFQSPHLSSVSLSSVLHQISKSTQDTLEKFHHLHKKSGSESKNVTSDFASKCTKIPENP